MLNKSTQHNTNLCRCKQQQTRPNKTSTANEGDENLYKGDQNLYIKGEFPYILP